MSMLLTPVEPEPTSPPPGVLPADPSFGDLLDALAPHGETPLSFAYGGRETLPGYHVTEVKEGRFASFDCGAQPAAWAEVYVQLWDVPGEPGQAPMAAAKFSTILDRVAHAFGVDPGSRLTFEVGDDVGVIALYTIDRLESGPSGVRIQLVPKQASCKPRDRWYQDAGLARPPRRSRDDVTAERAIRSASGRSCCGTAPREVGACCA